MSRFRTRRTYRVPTPLEVTCRDCHAKRGVACRGGAGTFCGARTLSADIIALRRYYLPKKREREEVPS